MRLGREGRGAGQYFLSGFPAAAFPLTPAAWTAQPVTHPRHPWNPVPSLTRLRAACSSQQLGTGRQGRQWPWQVSPAPNSPAPRSQGSSCPLTRGPAHPFGRCPGSPPRSQGQDGRRPDSRRAGPPRGAASACAPYSSCRWMGNSCWTREQDSAPQTPPRTRPAEQVRGQDRGRGLGEELDPHWPVMGGGAWGACLGRGLYKGRYPGGS